MSKSKDSTISITDLWNLCVARWRWFAVSVSIALLLAVSYLVKTPFLYTRNAAVMVLDVSAGGNSTEKSNSDITQIGLIKQNDNMDNFVRHITSLSMMTEVARRLYPDMSEGEVFEKAVDIQSRLSAEINGLKTTIIDLTYKDFSTLEAERVLTMVIDVYIDKSLESKLLTIKKTSRFIDERLQLLRDDLDIVDDSIAVFKSRYGITDLEHVSDIYLQQQSQSDAEIMKLSSQKTMAEFIRDLLEDKSSKRQLLLVNSGLNNSMIEAQITLYNTLILELQSHLKYTSEQNPLIAHQEEEIDNLHGKILANIKNHIHTIDIQLSSLTNFNNEATSKIVSNPSQAKHLATIERERKVKESLYMYLLQKKEENEISITYLSSNIETIEIPHGSGKPSSPKRLRVLLAAVLIGILIPVIFLFLRATMDETVRDRFDIEHNSNIPFLGEVPYSGREHSLESLLMPFGKGRKAKASGIVVGPDMLDASNEAFRVLRNNIESLTKEKNLNNIGRVYLVKSTEMEVGKTFVAMNLALVKTIGGQRVLFIDGDLRQASASRLWRTPLLGLTDYLHGEESDFRKLLWHPESYPSLDVLPAGALPTNPTELLRGPLLDELINTAKLQYDSIIIDSPSAGILADADIYDRVIDCALLIIRAGRFKRHRLNELSPIEIINGTSKPQYIILNGVSINARYGYAYVHKYERSEEDKSTVEISKRTIMLNKIIFKKKKQRT